ncbi:hypothetical protein [Frankia sp. ArI3]|uniref:hypothetical protein n=1 Tax=Frankia sp. ArI3 TaxID=1858 RepID=UPI0006990F2A|nr:hypothetical protein [Frankia sp. ArI3]
MSYEMVVRKVWSDSEDIKIRRARARDLSRQFRGEKQIDWNVIENYVELLYPEDQSQRTAQLERCRPLHLQAFGPPGDSDADRVSDGAVDPAYVADLERQLVEARMRAAFATALLVIVRSENAVLRGKNAHFGWFQTRGPAEESERMPGASTESGDPATAPIQRRQGHRGGHHHRRDRPIVAFSDLVAEQPSPAGWSAPGPLPYPAENALHSAPTGPTPVIEARQRRAPEATRAAAADNARGRRVAKASGAEPDILAGPERKRRGRGR